ncbi:MAG: hypothetical protein WAK11_00795 [Candidatus Cybelea sp.]
MREIGVECSYDICNCTVSSPIGTGEVYCSEACQDASESSIEADNCVCGHPPCDEP